MVVEKVSHRQVCPIASHFVFINVSFIHTVEGWKEELLSGIKVCSVSFKRDKRSYTLGEEVLKRQREHHMLLHLSILF